MSDELVTIARFKSGAEAELLRGQLLAEGIASVLQGDAVSTLQPGLAGSWASVRVQVRRDDAPTAARLVAAHDALLSRPHEPGTAEACLACGASLAPEAQRCGACGWTWKSAESP